MTTSIDSSAIDATAIDATAIDERAELVKAALLGTQRYDLPGLDADTLLGKLDAQLGDAEPPHRLLSMAGAYFLRRRAGLQPHRVAAPSVVIPTAASELEDSDNQSGADQQPRVCSSLASQNLAAILWGFSSDLIGEFLTALGQHNQRIPEQYLPTVLARGAKSVPLRPTVLPVLGPSGRWLAMQNPAWAYASDGAATWDGAVELLKQLPSTKRQGFLRQLRTTHPPLAREILSNQWKSLSSADRALYIKTMEHSLGLEDESILELALDDRNNVVRRKAAELLAKLPGSQLCQRMTENTAGFLTWSPEKDIRITVKFPAEITPRLVKDGVMLRKLRDESRVRAYQMKEMVGAIPLNHWCELWDATPAEIIEAARSSRWPRTLKQAFVIATDRQKDIAWAKALLAADGYGVSSIRLINLLPIEECTAILKAELPAEFEPLTKENLVVRILRKRRDPWPADLATMWFDLLVQHLEYARVQLLAQQKRAKKELTKAAATKEEKKKVEKAATKLEKKKKEVDWSTIDPILRLMIRQSGRCAPVELTDHVVERLRPFSQEFNVWRPILQELISTMKFRQAMLKNIAEG